MLNLINWLLQLPVIAPFVQSVYWAIVCILASLLAPVVFLNGVRMSFADAFLSRENDVRERSFLGVLVTGCDTGFGRAVAVGLAQRGYTVFAGCLSATAIEAEGVPEGNLHVCGMDVTHQADVDKVVNTVQTWVEADPRRRLLCVANNAGVGSGGPLDWLSMEDFERDMNVNFFGCVRVCKAFLPLLRHSSTEAAASSGATPRIVVVSSMSGKLPVPFLSTYASSKHAVTCLAACMRMELADLWGINVCTALPSFHRTPMTEGGVRSIRSLWESLPRSVKAIYGDQCAKSSFRVADQMMSDWAWEPARVSEALVRVISQQRPPPAELTIGTDAWTVLHALRHLPPPIYEWVISRSLLWQFERPEASQCKRPKNE